MLMNKITKFLSIPFILLLLYIIIIDFIPISYAQIFEFEDEDYYESKEKKEENPPTTTTNSKDKSAKPNSEDTDKDTCIDGNRIESAAILSSDSDKKSDSYYSDFHFVKKFDKKGNLVDSWGKVGTKDGQFLHAHGITIDS